MDHKWLRVNWSLKDNNLVKYDKEEMKNNKNFESKENTTYNSFYVINSFFLLQCKYKYDLEQKEFFFFLEHKLFQKSKHRKELKHLNMFQRSKL